MPWGGQKEKRKKEKKKELRRCVQGFSQEAMRIEHEQMPRNWNKNPPPSPRELLLHPRVEDYCFGVSPLGWIFFTQKRLR